MCICVFRYYQGYLPQTSVVEPYSGQTVKSRKEPGGQSRNAAASRLNLTKCSFLGQVPPNCPKRAIASKLHAEAHSAGWMAFLDNAWIATTTRRPV